MILETSPPASNWYFQHQVNIYLIYLIIRISYQIIPVFGSMIILGSTLLLITTWDGWTFRQLHAVFIFSTLSQFKFIVAQELQFSWSSVCVWLNGTLIETCDDLTSPPTSAFEQYVWFTSVSEIPVFGFTICQGSALHAALATLKIRISLLKKKKKLNKEKEFGWIKCL